MLHIQRPRFRCPACGDPVDAIDRLFRKDFHCEQCQTALHISATYCRTLWFLSVAIAFALLWVSGKRDTLRVSLFLLPTAFLILTIVVRIAPFLVAPALIAGEAPGNITTLGLASASAKGTKSPR